MSLECISSNSVHEDACARVYSFYKLSSPLERAHNYIDLTLQK